MLKEGAATIKASALAKIASLFQRAKNWKFSKHPSAKWIVVYSGREYYESTYVVWKEKEQNTAKINNVDDLDRDKNEQQKSDSKEKLVYKSTWSLGPQS